VERSKETVSGTDQGIATWRAVSFARPCALGNSEMSE